jgi:hypothetical protein
VIGVAHLTSRLPVRTLSAAAVAAGSLGLAGTAVADSGTSAPPSPLLTFVPPKVGPIRVDIGPTIISGKVMDPGLHVALPGFSLPPMTWTLPVSTVALPAGGLSVYPWLYGRTW